MLMLVALGRACGYYFDMGACATEVVSGEIAVFRGDTVAFKDGSTAKPDIVVFAISTVWSLDEDSVSACGWGTYTRYSSSI